MSMNFETYLEARRIESEIRNSKAARRERLGPLPDPPPRRSRAVPLCGLVTWLRTLAAGPDTRDDGSATTSTATGG